METNRGGADAELAAGRWSPRPSRGRRRKDEPKRCPSSVDRRYSRLAERLVEGPRGARSALDAYVACGDAALGASRKSRDELKKRNAAVEAARKAYVERKPNRGQHRGGGGDLWQAENALRVACRRAAQQQSHFSSQVAESEACVLALERWRARSMEAHVERFAKICQVFRDDLARVGERLVKCGREPCGNPG